MGKKKILGSLVTRLCGRVTLRQDDDLGTRKLCTEEGRQAQISEVLED